VVDKDQKPVIYSPQAGYTALIKNVELRDFVSEFATQLLNFKQSELEELGNG
jgi:hypothetical protein